ncbi:condensation domain-containing protein [Vibrio vulnificus]|uniref:condensation domain-containing protein n=1 Tax=Vibrio vulnificus TaxID=672 RepID=UPI001F4DD494|nr:condensation domain-containing protein [Vibrio vulnificus]MCU8188870.1 condensation domain-containing protein [Vibrio vulnificus]MCU8197565.1 condensation domain-containing protein [Vibrio vulnificus]MCU8255545.1 condensation domain-containing protein [Vibrio vulnificus]MCU8311897.1 condensation domain-containing protein [Vibrio vulnificus]MCU8443460.1 condensation domain-containing protein [Vibrio vulnificus]
MSKPVFFPLSLAQQEYWAEYLAFPERPFSNVAHCIEISGECDIECLYQAILETTQEAEALRLSFGCDEQGYPRQVVLGCSAIVLDCINLTDEAEAEQLAWQKIRDDIAKPIDLTGKVLTYQAIFRLSEVKTLWYIRSHHIALDGYSLHLIEQRCASLYSAFIQSQTLPVVFKGFDTYVRNEQAYLCSERAEKDQRFWLDYINQHPFISYNDDDFNNDTFAVAKEVDPELRAALLNVSQQQQWAWVDLLVVLVGLYCVEKQVLTEQQSASDGLWIWLPYLNRMGNRCANTPCLMVNTLPLWINVDIEENFVDRVKRLMAELRLLYRHGKYPLSNSLNVKASQSPYINVLIDEDIVFGGCQSERKVVANGTNDGLNMTFRVRKDAANITFTVEGEQRWFGQEQITHLSEQLMVFMHQSLNTLAEQNSGQ